MNNRQGKKRNTEISKSLSNKGDKNVGICSFFQDGIKLRTGAMQQQQQHAAYMY
jgi:hypothetical protein